MITKYNFYKFDESIACLFHVVDLQFCKKEFDESIPNALIVHHLTCLE